MESSVNNKPSAARYRLGSVHVIFLPILVVASVCVSGQVPTSPAGASVPTGEPGSSGKPGSSGEPEASAPAIPPAPDAQPETVDRALENAGEALAARQIAVAVGWYQRALQLDPRNRAARIGLADAYRDAGQDLEAKRVYEEYISSEGRNDPRAHLGLGLILQKSQYYLQAEQKLRECLRLDSNNITARKSLAVTLHARSKMDPARQYAQSVVDGDPEDDEARHLLSRILADSRPPDLTGAAAQAELAIKIIRGKYAKEPEQTGYLRVMPIYYRTLLNIRQRQERDRSEDAGLAKQIHDAIREVADIEYALRMFSALPYAVRAAELAPGNVNALTTLAELQWQLHLHDHMAETCWTILEAEPDHALAKQRLDELGMPSQRPTSQPTSQTAATPSDP
jgi:tetratricopeptide (TPR) repeat protein